MSKLGTRAVLLKVEGGSNFEDCNYCDERIKFLGVAALKSSAHLPGVVICNVYKRGKWDHLEQYHPDCYDVAGQPRGELQDRS